MNSAPSVAKDHGQRSAQEADPDFSVQARSQDPAKRVLAGNHDPAKRVLGVTRNQPGPKDYALAEVALVKHVARVC